MEIISGIYKITNTITGDFYIGSSKDVKHRWVSHKCPSVWKRFPSSQLYLDMKKYGTDKFEFQILEEVEVDKLKKKEQKFIETLKPTYNSNNANGLNVDKRKKSKRKYRQSDKYKETQKKYDNQLCYFNGETLTLHALSMRFKRKGIPHPVIEAKKYLLQ